jgi:hypothetical protein
MLTLVAVVLSIDLSAALWGMIGWIHCRCLVMTRSRFFRDRAGSPQLESAASLPGRAATVPASLAQAVPGARDAATLLITFRITLQTQPPDCDKARRITAVDEDAT